MDDAGPKDASPVPVHKINQHRYRESSVVPEASSHLGHNNQYMSGISCIVLNSFQYHKNRYEPSSCHISSGGTYTCRDP